jgi:hypothetical protein
VIKAFQLKCHFAERRSAECRGALCTAPMSSFARKRGSKDAQKEVYLGKTRVLCWGGGEARFISQLILKYPYLLLYLFKNM